MLHLVKADPSMHKNKKRCDDDNDCASEAGGSQNPVISTPGSEKRFFFSAAASLIIDCICILNRLQSQRQPLIAIAKEGRQSKTRTMMPAVEGRVVEKR